MADMLSVIKESFGQYAGAVLQSRALVDVRDCLKPSARQIFYCLYTDKFVHSKPFKKTLKAIGSAMRMYIHGDSSAEGIIMRAGQPFAFRYPLVEVEGSYGTLAESGNWAASRYTSSRLSQISDILFKDIEKNTITEWRDNYDDTEQYPMSLPSKGFYNIVNGTMGIGTGASSSIPQFNIKDINEALIKLLWNSEIDDDELICMPDFATGAILLNADEVRESLKNGHGKSCILRSVVEYNEKERCFVVTEIPYGVYTNTICGQLENLINEGNSGIDKFNDLTGSTPLIKIYLSKNANPEMVLKRLYKETSLQYYYSINLTMLNNGRFPKVFTWKEALQSHIDHEKIVYRRGYEFDLEKINARLHIIDGIIIALNNIEEVIEIIKSSASTAAARSNLCSTFGLSDIQAKSILDIKLARLARLEIEKYYNEKNELEAKKAEIVKILSDEVLFNKQIENGLRAVAEKYGDSRRTQIINLEINDNETPIEKKTIIVNLTNKGNLYAYESNTLITQKRGGKGIKAKLPQGEYIVNSISEVNSNMLLLFSNKGKAYNILLNNLELNTPTYPETLFKMDVDEYICNICSYDKTDSNEYIIFTTKFGMVKKSKLSEYKMKKSNGIIAIKLKENDSIVSIGFTSNDTLGILTSNGNFVRIETDTINPTGRVSMGVTGIKLSGNDEVVCACLIPNDTKTILSISMAGLAKQTDISEFPITSRAIKGSSIQKLKDNDSMSYFLPIDNSKNELIVISTNGNIKIPLSQISCCGRHTVGTQAKKLSENEKIKSLITN